MEFFIALIVHGLFVGSTYALLALGYSMVYGVLGLINFAHGDVLMLGTLVCYSTIQTISKVFPSMPHGANLTISILISMIVSGAIGAIVELLAYRRVREASSLVCLSTAIGTSIILQSIAMIIWGRDYFKFPQYISMENVNFLGLSAQFSQLVTIVTAAIIMVMLWIFVRKTRMGLSIRAVSEKSKIAELMGINSNEVISVTFIIGSALAAVSGIMLSSNYGIAHYNMGFMPGVKAFTAAVLGGIGSIPGSMIGGILLGVIESLSTGYIATWTNGILNSNYQNVFSFVILVVVLLVRPNGLFGTNNPDRA
ncbi:MULTISPECIES: branched-chain amino acid ABC transporter permease [Candidatus Ichthyocystis]|uniref:Branched-chain amino acid transporter permease subunit LivH n=1 Tax=Candidatus Ichthyocystis hellenicum TaxID=1561003 RepID=A0A0S4M2L6_9BURK|nr:MULTISPECIES: branched-chain amino acid ABC transporter permease [Ichthyocystis]CUT17515.1 branched-chain amino acid transporter permease subunit LivH [Candidatus Ichthyocystis hellenicum]